MTALEFLLTLRPALPFSKERGRVAPPSNGEVKRWLLNKAVSINGVRLAPGQDVQFPVTSLVFFPTSETNRCTLF